jgi:hypothetical protein
MDMVADCNWCGLLLDSECPQPAEHQRLHSESETTWRRAAERPMPRVSPSPLLGVVRSEP